MGDGSKSIIMCFVPRSHYAGWPDEATKAPDADPKDNLGHGTHVSGIIAGKSDL